MSSLPGAIGMFAFSLGVLHIGDKLPGVVYALLSGFNAATVGIVALAAMQLSQKVITDKLTRALVFLGGTAGILYTALWYFPVLMAVAGIVTMIWDLRVVQKLAVASGWRGSRNPRTIELEEAQAGSQTGANLPRTSTASTTPATLQHDGATTTGFGQTHNPRPYSTHGNTPSTPEETPIAQSPPQQPLPPPSRTHTTILSWQRGIFVLAIFLTSFLTIMLLRALHPSPPRLFSLFANLFLAGTIIFGGGPVVIPLLREYIVAEGWVSPRDFLLGLALIQAFPGPNFNFAVYLGALATNASSPFLGASTAFLGIFIPGLAAQTGFMGLWGLLRKNRPLLSALRGVNAAAVGLVFTAVYRLWQIGYLDREDQDGRPLGSGSPWWVVVTATSFVGGNSFGLSPPGAVVLGGAMGIVRYGVQQRNA
ncbi:MAG: hypothetical protein Q9219_006960 [cf. Caloplaca sp. 3 TL-2023]